VLTNLDGCEALLDETGKEVGHLEAKICFCEQDLNEWTNFAQIAGGFSEYAAQIPSPEVWPIAVFVDLEIYPEFRKRGHGRAALRQFLRHAITKGAKVALLRVAWYGDNPAGERAWRIAWYAREGFRELENRAPQLLIPFMYRLL
jgi:GNAT superfamily N-acetyltransferase